MPLITCWRWETILAAICLNRATKHIAFRKISRRWNKKNHWRKQFSHVSLVFNESVKLTSFWQLESFKNFDFELWRQRYITWVRNKKFRITDFFRRQDKQGYGTLMRQEFVEGMLTSSKSTDLKLFLWLAHLVVTFIVCVSCGLPVFHHQKRTIRPEKRRQFGIVRQFMWPWAFLLFLQNSPRTRQNWTRCLTYLIAAGRERLITGSLSMLCGRTDR